MVPNDILHPAISTPTAPIPTSSLFPGNTTTPSTGSPSFDNLVPALLQVFVVILCGYVAGRSGHVSVSQGKGIASFVTTFCLPALLFRAMCTLDFSQVNKNFLLAILLSKLTVFVVVVLGTMLVKRNLPVGYAGLYAIFATQSNDFALGYPLVQALYQDSHPDYVNYIYLIAPISLLILNPIGFIMMEVHRHIHPQSSAQQIEESSSASTSSVSRRQRLDSTGSTNGQGERGRERSVAAGVKQVIKGVLLNPIVFMTAIGLVGNFVFSGKVPSLLDNALSLLGEAFSGTALFYLGLSMVDRVKTSVDKALIVPMLLILAKSLLLPMVTWEVVSWLQADQVTSTDLSMYGFLYGTFPPAPSVVLFAVQYNLGQDTVTRGLVIGTMLSAPLMFASAEMMTVVVSDENDYHSIILNTSFDVSIVSIVACVWVLGVFVFSGRWRRVPHRFTVCLVASQMVACIGMVMSRAIGQPKGGWHYVQFVTMLLGVFSSRCCTAALSVACCLLHTRSLCSVLKAQVWLLLLGFGFPCVMTGLLFMVGAKHISDEIDPSFHYGFIQTLFSAIVLAVSLLITLVSVVIWQRNARHYPPYSPIPPTTSPTTTPSTTTPGLSGGERENVSIQADGGDCVTHRSPPLSPKHNNYNSCSSIEDIIPFPTPGSQLLRSEGGAAVEDHGVGLATVATIDERTCLLGRCSAEERRECRQRLRRYAAGMDGDGGGEDSPRDEESVEREEGLKEEYQSTHHLLLLVVLSASMAVGLFLCLWKIIKNQVSGIYVEIEFLDSFFNYGQAFLTMLIFGFDTRLVFSPIMRRVRRWLYGAELVRLPESWELDEDTQTTCHQFITFHLANCRSRISREGRFRLRRYENVFTGEELCHWLLEAGLAADQGEAVEYGRRLLLGRVIAHVTGIHHFQCSRFFYTFVDSDDASC